MFMFAVHLLFESNFQMQFNFSKLNVKLIQGANIQLLDLPGIIEGASQGKGRGRQVIAVARDKTNVSIQEISINRPLQSRSRTLKQSVWFLNPKKPTVWSDFDTQETTLLNHYFKICFLQIES